MRLMPDAMSAILSAHAPANSPVSRESDPAEYRKALSCFATGVTVVTARCQDLSLIHI